MTPQSLLYIALLLAGHVKAAAPACVPEAGRNSETITGQTAAGELFEKSTTNGWVLRLSPDEYGWVIRISERDNPDENMSRLTPPLHGTNPRFLEGWHFRNSANTGPNDGSVNAFQELRNFIFSPELDRIIGDVNDPTSSEDVEMVSEFGRGWLYLDAYALTPPLAGERASFETISFTVCLTWPDVAGGK